MTFGERTLRQNKEKELINSNDSRLSNKAKLKARLNLAYANAKTVDEYQFLLDRIFAEDLELSSAGRSTTNKINSSGKRDFFPVESGRSVINSLDLPIPKVKTIDMTPVINHNININMFNPMDTNRADTGRVTISSDTNRNAIDTNRQDTNRLDTNRLIEKADN
jgi:hypothetical protein